MNLTFSTKLPNGKETHFVEKIWAGLPSSVIDAEFRLKHERPYCDLAECKGLEPMNNCRPKYHTIRDDDKNRWEVGRDIHFYIYPRSADMFQFAPIVKVQRIQTITINWELNVNLGKTQPFERRDGRYPWIIIDYKYVLDQDEIIELALNDGFDTVEEFLEWFKDGIIDGKIIHWNRIVYGA